MSLHVIVDGYNFIHASGGLSALPSGDLEAARAALVAELARYRRLRHHQVSAVFDGTKAPPLPPGVGRRSQVNGVSIVFSRPGQEADEVICEMARKGGMRTVVVTADSALAESCRRFGAAVVAPEEFEGLMVAAEDSLSADEAAAPAAKKGPAHRAPRQVRKERLRKNKL